MQWTIACIFMMTALRLGSVLELEKVTTESQEELLGGSLTYSQILQSNRENLKKQECELKRSRSW